MRTQYLVHSRRSVDIALAAGRTGTCKCEVKTQDPINIDVLAGQLDLPSGDLGTKALERYLKTTALFYEHVLIPDGWLHCQGPIAFYLQSCFARAARKTRNPECHNEFRRNLVFGLLREKILVPLLRGKRPENPQDSPIGFDLLGPYEGRDKRLQDLGVYFDSDDNRMMVLDATDANKTILSELSTRIRLFADWTSPDVPVDAVGYDQKADLREWDTTLSQRVFQEILEGENPDVAIDQLEAKMECMRFWHEFRGRVEDVRSELIRRGTIERLVAAVLKSDAQRLKAYTQLRLGSVSHFVASLALNRVSTVQEAMFADRFNCHRGYCLHYSPEALPEATQMGFPDSTQRFDRFVYGDCRLNVDALGFDAIMDLRCTVGRRYFEAKREYSARRGNDPMIRFWEDPVFSPVLREYLHEIQKSAPLTPTEMKLIQGVANQGVNRALGVITCFCGEFGAGIALGALGPVIIWAAEKMLALPVGYFSDEAYDTLAKKVLGPLAAKSRKWRIDAAFRKANLCDDLGRTARP
ncbi:MAG: hypothetical protein JXB62_08300 [Pirellulales bacterium]|nr:hypothetical protein [Pirellulales bacterium]